MRDGCASACLSVRDGDGSVHGDEDASAGGVRDGSEDGDGARAHYQLRGASAGGLQARLRHDRGAPSAGGVQADPRDRLRDPDLHGVQARAVNPAGDHLLHAAFDATGERAREAEVRHLPQDPVRLRDRGPDDVHTRASRPERDGDHDGSRNPDAAGTGPPDAVRAGSGQ